MNLETIETIDYQFQFYEQQELPFLSSEHSDYQEDKVSETFL